MFANGTIVTVVEENRDDPNYEPLQENLARLREMKSRGTPLEIVTLPMPARIDREDLRLPASYANFYIANKSILLPTFNDPNDKSPKPFWRALLGLAASSGSIAPN